MQNREGAVGSNDRVPLQVYIVGLEISPDMEVNAVSILLQMTLWPRAASAMANATLSTSSYLFF